MTTRNELLDARLEAYHTQLIPDMGKCDTVQGEMLRAINKIMYRYFNDGDYYFDDYGCETAGPAQAYLSSYSPLKDKLNPIFEQANWKYSQDYINHMYEVLEVICDHIDSCEGQYTANEMDMLDCEAKFNPAYDDDDLYDCYDDDFYDCGGDGEEYEDED